MDSIDKREAERAAAAFSSLARIASFAASRLATDASSSISSTKRVGSGCVIACRARAHATKTNIFPLTHNIKQRGSCESWRWKFEVLT